MQQGTRSLTAGKPRAVIFWYMLPLLIGNVVQQSYNIADAFIVGRLLGPDVLAAVGSVGTLMFLILGFAQAATAGFCIPMSQRFGRGDMLGVKRSFLVSLSLCAVIAALITIAGAIYAPQLLQLMNTPANILEDASTYLRTIFLGSVSMIGYNLGASVLRALGDSRTPLYFLMVSAIVNIILDLVFIAGFGWGVRGAALATVLSQAFSVLCCALYIHLRLPILHSHRADISYTWLEVREHLRLGLPMGIQASIIAIGSVAIQIALNAHGSSTLAAYTAAQRIEQLAMFPFVSFGVAVGVFAAQNFGAGEMQRVHDGVRETAKMSGLYALIVGILLLLFSGALVRAFFGAGATEEIVHLGQLYLWVTVPFYPSLLLIFVYRYTLQGVGKTFAPTLAGFVELGMRLGTALFIAPQFGYIGILVCHPLAWIGAWVVVGASYRRFRRQHHVAPRPVHQSAPACA